MHLRKSLLYEALKTLLGLFQTIATSLHQVMEHYHEFIFKRKMKALHKEVCNVPKCSIEVKMIIFPLYILPLTKSFREQVPDNYRSGSSCFQWRGNETWRLSMTCLRSQNQHMGKNDLKLSFLIQTQCSSHILCMHTQHIITRIGNQSKTKNLSRKPKCTPQIAAKRKGRAGGLQASIQCLLNPCQERHKQGFYLGSRPNLALIHHWREITVYSSDIEQVL